MTKLQEMCSLAVTMSYDMFHLSAVQTTRKMTEKTDIIEKI